MSFRCGICKSVSFPHEPANRVVLEYRSRTYDRGNGETVEGREIVREVLACGTCAGKENTRTSVATGGATIGDVWDGQIEQDVIAGKLDAVADEALAEPVPVQKIEELFPKAKKQKRTKKAKGEETEA